MLQPYARLSVCGVKKQYTFVGGTTGSKRTPAKTADNELSFNSHARKSRAMSPASRLDLQCRSILSATWRGIFPPIHATMCTLSTLPRLVKSMGRSGALAGDATDNHALPPPLGK